jgi:hypothetical protein
MKSIIINWNDNIDKFPSLNSEYPLPITDLLDIVYKIKNPEYFLDIIKILVKNNMLYNDLYQGYTICIPLELIKRFGSTLYAVKIFEYIMSLGIFRNTIYSHHVEIFVKEKYITVCEISNKLLKIMLNNITVPIKQTYDTNCINFYNIIINQYGKIPVPLCDTIMNSTYLDFYFTLKLLHNKDFNVEYKKQFIDRKLGYYDDEFNYDQDVNKYLIKRNNLYETLKLDHKKLNIINKLQIIKMLLLICKFNKLTNVNNIMRYILVYFII